jgi:mRNA interferase RelE/StbE
MNYEVLILRKESKQLSDLPLRDYERIKRLISGLAYTPRPQGCLKLTGRSGWRIRAGDYRVIYEVDDKNRTVTVLHIGNRRDIYS